MFFRIFTYFFITFRFCREIDEKCNELYIVVYSKNKSVNAKPLAQVRLAMEDIQKEERIKRWISVEGVVEIFVNCCYAKCFTACSNL